MRGVHDSACAWLPAPPGAHVQHLVISVQNPTSTTISFRVMANLDACNAHGTACSRSGLPAGDEVQWWNGSAWQRVAISAQGAVPVAPQQMPGGAGTRIRLRLINRASSHQTGRFDFFVETPNPLAFIELKSAAFALG